MTGAYLRVERDGKWETIEVEHLTHKEREEIFKQKSSEEILKWFHLVCESLSRVDNDLKRIAEEHMNEMQEEG